MVGDCSFKEPDHVGDKLVWVVKEDVVAAVFKFENLRAASFKVTVALDDLVCSFRAEEVSVTEDKGNGEVNLRVAQPVGCCQLVVRMGEVSAKIECDDFNLALALHHAREVMSSNTSGCWLVHSQRSELLELTHAHALE